MSSTEAVCDVLDLRQQPDTSKAITKCGVYGCWEPALGVVRIGNNHVYWGSRFCYHHGLKLLRDLQELFAGMTRR